MPKILKKLGKWFLILLLIGSIIRVFRLLTPIVIDKFYPQHQFESITSRSPDDDIRWGIQYAKGKLANGENKEISSKLMQFKIWLSKPKMHDRINRYAFDKLKQWVPETKKGALILIEQGYCNHIEHAYLDKEHRTAKAPVFRYECENRVGNTSYYLSLNDVNTGKPPYPSHNPDLDDKGTLTLQCEKLLKQKLNFPKSFKANRWDRVYGVIENNGRFIELPFSAKNAFGMGKDHIGTCWFHIDGKVTSTIQ